MEQEFVEVTFDSVQACTEEAAMLIIEDEFGNSEEFWIAYRFILDGDHTVRHQKRLQDQGQRRTVIGPLKLMIAEWLAVKLELV